MKTKDRLTKLEESVEDIKTHLGIEAKQEYPDHIVGKWWWTKEGGMYKIMEVGGGKCYGYGFESCRVWDTGHRCSKYDLSRPATCGEVEEALINEAKKREVWDTPDIGTIDGYGVCAGGDLSAAYIAITDRLWSRYGVVYEKGEWATPKPKQPKMPQRIDDVRGRFWYIGSLGSILKGGGVDDNHFSTEERAKAMLALGRLRELHAATVSGGGDELHEHFTINSMDGMIEVNFGFESVEQRDEFKHLHGYLIETVRKGL